MRALFVIAIVLAAAPARAEDVGVVVTGEATLQPPLAASLEGWVREHGHKLVSSPLEADAINALIDCFVLEDLGCARGVVERRAKSHAIVFARVEVVGGEGMGSVTLVGYWLQKGHDAVGERRTCAQCNPQKLRTTADDLMAALAAEPPPPDPKTAKAEIQLHETPRPAPSRTLPLVVLGAGAALAVTGGVMLAINKSPSKTGVQEPSYRDYGPAGYALVGIGAAAIGAGVYMWFRSSASSAPVAAVSPGGAVVGWTGRF